MDNSFTLIGTINLFNIIPDFVFPVFECNGILYFQHGDHDEIYEFEEVKKSVYDRVVFLDNNSTTCVINTASKPIYAFQKSDNEIIYGNSLQIRSFLKSYHIRDEILKNEIEDFYKEVEYTVPQKTPLSTSIKRCVFGIGRRNKAIAHVCISPKGNGSIIINNRDINDFFTRETHKMIIQQPLHATETVGKMDIACNVYGGNNLDKVNAIRNGIAFALTKVDSEYTPTLRAAGYLTHKSRIKVRKKYGLEAARKNVFEVANKYVFVAASPAHSHIRLKKNFKSSSSSSTES